MHELSAAQKAALAVRTLRNWPLVLPDKLRLRETIRYRTRSGLAVTCRSGTPDVNELVVVTSGYEYPAHRLGPGAVVIDVGANIGSFSLWVMAEHRDLDLAVFAFEPFPPNVELLRRNLDENGFGSVVVEPSAVAGADGWALLDTGAAADEIRIDTAGDLRVPTVSLAGYCRRSGIGRIDLLKLDVEGAEYDIFEADRDFVVERVDRVVLEYHGGIVEDPLDFFRRRFAHHFDIGVHRRRERSGILTMTRRAA